MTPIQTRATRSVAERLLYELRGGREVATPDLVHWCAGDAPNGRAQVWTKLLELERQGLVTRRAVKRRGDYKRTLWKLA